MSNFLKNFKNAKPAVEKPNADAPQRKFDKGQYLFGKQCAACHTIGHGDKIGPDLLGVVNLRNRDWLVRIIEKPDQLLVEKDPIAMKLFKKYKKVQMPNLRLNDEETNLLIGYLVSAVGGKTAAGGRKGGEKKKKK